MQRNHNKLIHQHAPKISPSELSLPRETRRTLSQLRTNKSPILISYLYKVDETHHPSPRCPLCKTNPHTTDHLFNCTHLYTSSSILDLWLSPERVAPLLIRWKRRLKGFSRETGCRTPPQLHAGGVGRQQQHGTYYTMIKSNGLQHMQNGNYYRHTYYTSFQTLY